jgi:hypothetical protein
MDNILQNTIQKVTKRQPITVRRVYKSSFQKEGSLTAELEQKIITTTKYPTSVMGNSLNNSLFEINDFNLPTKNFENTEKGKEYN